MKKVIALLITLLLIFSSVSVAFADTDFPYYVAIGDSICGGFGLQGTDLKRLVADTDFVNNVVHNSAPTCYPRLVANAVARTYGKDEAEDSDFANLGAVGFSIGDFYYAYTASAEELESYVNSFWLKFAPIASQILYPKEETNWDNYKGWCKILLEETKKADIITYNIGANDILQPFWDTLTDNENPIIRIFGYIFKIYSLEMDPIEMIRTVDFSGILGGDIDDILSEITPKTIADAIKFINMKTFSDNMLQGVEAIRETYVNTLKKIQEINPDAKIIIVGLHNPYGTGWKYRNIKSTICEDIESGDYCVIEELINMLQYVVLHSTLGLTAEKAIDALNDLQEQTAEDFGLPFVYTKDKVSNGAIVAVHPKARQHQQIAEEIKKVLMPELNTIK